MKNLIIIGARGFGRETYALALESLGYGSEFKVKGFLDDKKNALQDYFGYPLILDSVEHYEIQDNDVFICALGDVIYKKKYTELILSKGGKFINLIHRSAFIGKNTTMGEGCIICRNVCISCDIKIGNYVTFQPYSVIGHDVVIGEYCHLNTYAFMGGFSVLEDMVTMHTHAVLVPHIKAEMNSIIGASSVAIRKVKAGTTVYGNPAVRLKY